MAEAPPTRALPEVMHEWIDARCLDFEAAWRRGESPQLEAILRAAPEQARRELFRQLLCVELEQRRGRAELPNSGEYRARFPEWLPELYAEFDHADAETVPPTAALSALNSSSFPRRFGDYELLCKIQGGGMGVVYEAREIHTNRHVALKMILNPENASAQDVYRFVNEYKTIRNLNDPHIMPVYDVGEVERQPYFTMMLMKGGDLLRHLPRYREDPRAAAQVLIHVARAVHFAHLRGVLHRDLKPANVLLDEADHPYLSDFGLARRIEDSPGVLTEPGAIVGTPQYMAPEQIRAEGPLTVAADIYSLGAVLYHLLTGHPPFQGTTVLDNAMQILNGAPVRPRMLNPRCDEGLEYVILKCLEKVPESRYKSAEELAEALERWLRGETVIPPTPSTWELLLRTCIAAANHKLHLSGVGRWRSIDLWDAGINLVRHGGLYALIVTDQPLGLLWLVWLATEFAWWWMFLTHFYRNDTPEVVERHLAIVWAGVTLAGLALFWVYASPFEHWTATNLFALYPPYTVVNGLAFFVVGRLYWGRYYLVGLAHFLLAAIMPLKLEFSPLVYGMFVAICMSAAAWSHDRAIRRYPPPS